MELLKAKSKLEGLQLEDYKSLEKEIEKISKEIKDFE